MTDSVQRRITQALYARLQTITTANGYRTTLGSNLALGRKAKKQESPVGAFLHGALFRVPGDQTVLDNTDQSGIVLGYQLDLATKATSDPYAALENAEADVHQCLEADDFLNMPVTIDAVEKNLLSGPFVITLLDADAADYGENTEHLSLRIDCPTIMQYGDPTLVL